MIPRGKRKDARHPPRQLAIAAAGTGLLSAPDITTVRRLRDAGVLTGGHRANQLVDPIKPGTYYVVSRWRVAVIKDDADGVFDEEVGAWAPTKRRKTLLISPTHDPTTITSHLPDGEGFDVTLSQEQIQRLYAR